MKQCYPLAIFITLFLSKFSTAQVTGDTAVCAGETVTYYVPYIGGASYNWSVSGGSTLSAIYADSLVVQWGAAGSGTLQVTQNSPVAFHSLNVTIYPRPVPVITHVPYPTCPPALGTQGGAQGADRKTCEKVCKYATVTYSTPLNAGSTYQWVVYGALGISGATTNTATVTWDSSATGTLVVYETNQWGCVDSAEICIEKVNLPVAQFSHPTSVCNNTTVNFNNLSTGASTYQWYFGDGGNSTQANPAHTYNGAGTYTITLIATNSCYCADTFQSSITVDSLPGPDITCPSTLCAFDTVTYTTSVSGCVYNWFAVGGTIIGPSNTQSVTVAWGGGQLGSLGLYVTGCAALCSDTTWVYVPIVPAVATIQGPAKVCPGSCEEYSLPLFSGATYKWSLNSGACGTLADSTCCEKVRICWPNAPSLVCNDTLTVQYYDSFLRCGGSGTLVIRVRPTLQIMGNSTVCANAPSMFFSSSGIACNWSIVPSGPVLSASPSASVTVNWLSTPGVYTLTAIPQLPNQACNDSAKLTVTVVAPPPMPVITGDTVVCLGSTAAYCINGPGVVSWLITGGTPTTGVGNCITVNWGSTPPFVVRAFSQMPNSPFCSSDTAVQNITPILSVPLPVISGTPNGCANATQTFTTGVVYPAGAVFTWSVTPANSGAVVSGQGTGTAGIQWGNNAPQNVTVTLTVSVCAQNVSSNFTVSLNPAPVPSVNQLGSLCAGGTAQLQAVGGAFTAYQWSGPGGFTAVTNPVTITQNGLYQVTVTDANTCTALTQYTVAYVSGPLASISTLNSLAYCIGTSYTVSMCALGNPNYTYLWNSGPVTQCINVTTPGAYNVTVTDVSNGCTAISNTITVTEDSCNGNGGGTCTPNGSISFIYTSCNPVAFTNTSVNGSSFSWNFGDFTGSNLANPTHTYSQAGFYLVTLSGYVPNTAGTDSCLLQDTAQLEIPLAARFDFVTDCYGYPVCFTDMSTYTAGNNITSWSWNFGDANTSVAPNPCHTYAVPGSYVVTLTISNGVCNAVYTDTVTVQPPPSAAFTFSNPSCVNTATFFTDASLGAINYWNWNFGDAGTSLNQNPAHSYLLAGPYPVTLIVGDTSGCYDTLTQTINIANPGVSGSIAAYPDTVVCAGTQVLLVAPFCAGCTYLWNTGSVNDSIITTATGTYTVTVTDANGCAYGTAVLIIVNNAPSVLIQNTGKNELCSGGFTNLQVPYNVNWLYNWISNDANANGQTNNAVTVFPAVPGVYTYQVAVTDTATGCADTSLPYNITIHPNPVPPVIMAVGPSMVCYGDTITLQAGHPDPTVTFLWSNGQVGNTISVTENGCYQVIATDSNSCSATANYCATVNPLPELCMFYEGCYDTCLPYTIMGPPDGVSYQWKLNGNYISGATSQNYTATVSGAYSVIVTNSYGCTDSTGVLDLYLYECPDSLCADLEIDTVYCDSADNYVMLYQIHNTSQITLNQVNLQILPPHLNVAYAPNLVIANIPSGGSSPVLSATIYNGNPGDVLCFRSHVYAFDTITEQELLCCLTDTECVTLPPCPTDTTCCYFKYVRDSVWCIQTPQGTRYGFQIWVQGCGTLAVAQAGGNGLLTGLNSPYVLNNSTIAITGNYVNTTDTVLCLSFLMSSGNVYCADTTICLRLHCPNTPPPCLLEFTDSICVGQSTTFTYGAPTAGLSFTWQFANGSPATATGPGPHTVTYATTGCHPVILIINSSQFTVDCIDSICVLPPPVASVVQSGGNLLAYPAGYNYQWYSMAPPWTILSGEVNQFYSPTLSNLYCVVVSSNDACKDTACIDFKPTGINQLPEGYWSIHPNPNSGSFTLQLNQLPAGPAEMIITNIVGEVIDERQLDVVAGGKQYYINHTGLAQGVYFVHLKTAKGSGVKRLVVR